MFVFEFLADIVRFVWRHFKWLIIIVLVLSYTIGTASTHQALVEPISHLYHGFFGSGIHLPKKKLVNG